MVGSWLGPRIVAVLRRIRRATTGPAQQLASQLRRPRVQLAVLFAIGLFIWGFLLVDLANRNWNGDLRGFPRFDEKRPHTTDLLSRMPLSPWGHDGQFYAILATDPFLLHEDTPRSIDSPAFRAQRISLSFFAWLSSAGSGGSLAVAVYVLLSWAGTLLTVALIGRQLLRTGASPLWILAIFFQIGLVVSTERAMLDSAATALVLSALALWARGSATAATLAATAATFTKETSAAVAGAMAVDAWRRGQRRRAVLIVAVPLGLFAAWVLHLRARFPRRSATMNNFDWPFAWMLDKLDHLEELAWSPWLQLTELFGLLSILSSFVFAARLLFRNRRRLLELSPSEMTLIVTCGLASILSIKVYLAVWDFSRVLLLLPVLSFTISLSSEDRPLRILGATAVVFGAASGFCALFLS